MENKMDLTIRHPITGKVLFSHTELACRARDPNYGKGRINLIHKTKVDGSSRVILRRTMTVTSCCRSFIYNHILPNAHKKKPSCLR